MRIHLRFFALFRERMNADSAEMTLEEGLTVGGLFDRIAGDLRLPPSLRRSILFAINREYASADTPLRDGDEVAFIPPVAGG